MTTTQIIVTLSGLAVIAWIVWRFWLWRGESSAACFHRRESGPARAFEFYAPRGFHLRRRGGNPCLWEARTPA